MAEDPQQSSSRLTTYLEAHNERESTPRGEGDWLVLIKSLAIRSLFALPLALGLLWASVWASRIVGSAKIQATPGIMFGLAFGYAFGFGLAARANRVNVLVYLVVGVLISAIVAAAIVGMHTLFPSLTASAGPKRFWFAAGAFGGTTIMCALLALWYESKATILK